MHPALAQAADLWFAHDCFWNRSLPMDVAHLVISTVMWATLSFVLSVLLDVLLVRHITKDSNHKWFFMHVVFNSQVVFWTIPGAISCLRDPMSGWAVPYDFAGQATTAAISGFHAYHAALYGPLTFEDKVHHGVNTFIVALIGVFLPWGNSLCLSNLIMCGFPGGIDYLNLTLMKYGVVGKPRRKAIARLLNLLIRWPFEFLCGYLFFVNWNIIPTTTALKFVMAAGGIAHCANAAYYCDQVIGAYHSDKVDNKKKE
jgi:hypothetical protein